MIDVRWSPPTDLQANSAFNVLGANVYRSTDSEAGPYIRLNSGPVGSSFWRDETRIALSLREDVSGSFLSRGADGDGHGRYVFRTRHSPIVLHPSPGSANATNLNVQVFVNGVQAFVQSIDSVHGLVSLRVTPTFDVASQVQSPAVLPTSDSDVVLATYKYVASQVTTRLARRVFYRVTTVASDVGTGRLVETPLALAAQTNSQEIEKLNWIWREAIRRNGWILDQGGERCKVFIRKTGGHRCGCWTSSHRQARSDCLNCFGTSFVGGYDGPYDITIAPDDGAKSITRSNRGLSMEHVQDTWTGPSPLLSQRDVIVKANGDRYGIGPVRMPSNRGMQLQQFFEMAHIDDSDIRYKIAIPDTSLMRAPETRYQAPGKGGATPMTSETAGIPDEREIRSNTVTGQNHDY
jgi:hypothetical protein